MNYKPIFDSVNKWEFEGFEDQDVILICCSWGRDLVDGELIYFMNTDNNYDISNVNNKNNNLDHLRKPVTKAIDEWDYRLEGISFTETSSKQHADIEIHFREDHNVGAGMTKNYYDGYRFITKSYVVITKGSFGFGFGFSDNQIEQIVKHEIGHVLGLGHANFDGNLMATQVNYGSGVIQIVKLMQCIKLMIGGLKWVMEKVAIVTWITFIIQNLNT